MMRGWGGGRGESRTKFLEFFCFGGGIDYPHFYCKTNGLLRIPKINITFETFSSTQQHLKNVVVSINQLFWTCFLIDRKQGIPYKIYGVSMFLEA